MDISKWTETWRQQSKRLKSETYAIYLVYKHPETPWYARLFAGLVVAYAFSPIDLIPDFIPVLGYLDDLILIPLGVAFALKMIPPAVMNECRLQAERELREGTPVNRYAAIVIVLIWISLAGLSIFWMVQFFS